MPFIATLREFPFCQVESRASLPVAELAGTDNQGWLGGQHGYFPLSTTYEKFFEWVWRVRSWRVVLSATVTTTKVYHDLISPYAYAFTTESIGEFAVDDVIEWPVGTAWSSGGSYAVSDIVSHVGEYWVALLSSGSGAPKEPGEEPTYWRLLTGAGSFAGAQEMMLLCTTARPLSGAVTATVDDAETFDDGEDAITYDTTATVTLDFAPGLSVPRWKRYGDLWLPRMEISVILQAEIAAGTQLELRSNFPTEDTTGLPDFGTVNMTMDGITVPLQYEAESESSNEDYSIAITRGITDWSLAVTPYSWYEFDPGDGLGPVWDSATGARTARAMPNP